TKAAYAVHCARCGGGEQHPLQHTARPVPRPQLLEPRAAEDILAVHGDPPQKCNVEVTLWKLQLQNQKNFTTSAWQSASAYSSRNRMSPLTSRSTNMKISQRIYFCGMTRRSAPSGTARCPRKPSRWNAWPSCRMP